MMPYCKNFGLSCMALSLAFWLVMLPSVGARANCYGGASPFSGAAPANCYGGASPFSGAAPASQTVVTETTTTTYQAVPVQAAPVQVCPTARSFGGAFGVPNGGCNTSFGVTHVNPNAFSAGGVAGGGGINIQGRRVRVKNNPGLFNSAAAAGGVNIVGTRRVKVKRN